MLSIFLRRILLAIPVLIAVASITFFLVRLAPGGPFDAEKAVSEQVMKNLNEVYNLNAPLSEQYFDYMSGVSFLPFSEHTYQQAPYQDTDKAGYEFLLKQMPKQIDWSKLSEYESQDMTVGAQELACVAGACEIV